MEISIADAAAAAQVQMNNELSVQTPIANTTAVGVSGTPASAAVASDVPTIVEVDGDGVSNQHEGVMPQSAIDALNQTDRKLYYAALNKLVVDGGSIRNEAEVIDAHAKVIGEKYKGRAAGKRV